MAIPTDVQEAYRRARNDPRISALLEERGIHAAIDRWDDETPSARNCARSFLRDQGFLPPVKD